MVLRRLLANRIPGIISSERKLVTDSAGAYLEAPHVTNWAALKFTIYCVPFITLGALIR